MYKSFAPYNFLLLKFTYIGTVLYVVKLISKILCWFRCAICDKKLLYSYLVIGYHASKEHQLKLAEYKERYMSQQQQKKEEKKTESKGGEDEVEIIEVVNKEGVKKPPVDSTGWCYTRCKEDTNYSFAWTIEGFRRKMEQFSNGQCLTSHVFK